MATYAIGDVQGCFDSLQRLLGEFAFNPRQDQLWFVGDLVNRGPRSLETLRFIKGLGDAAVTVLGNHDLYLLMVATGTARKRGKDDTLGEILAAPDCEELLTWLRHRPLCHVRAPFCMVHAGLLPQWSVADAEQLSREVEDALQAPNYKEFMAHMWGSEPAAWNPELRGWERLRVVVNAMTRMRFCTPAGVMEFHAKGELSDCPTGHMPWFEAPGRQNLDHVLVTGHWSALGLRISPNLLALDTGCLWGGQLTAIRLEDRQVFQVNCGEGEAQPLG